MKNNHTLPTDDQLHAFIDNLNDRVFAADSGFDALTPPEKHCYATSMLLRQVYNGGLEQFFSNSTRSLLNDALAGLLALKAISTRETLLAAARLVYPDFEEPSEITASASWEETYGELDDTLHKNSTQNALEKLDQKIGIDTDEVKRKIAQYANDCGLLTPAFASENRR